MRCIYIVFLKTDYATGRLIRFATGYEYNHVSFSLDPGLTSLYSFSRYYNNAALLAGFVEESLLRYRSGRTRMMVCRVPLEQAQAEKLDRYLAHVMEHKEEYIYNIVSAAVAPMHRRVDIRNAYTCVEFAGEVLSAVGVSEAPKSGSYCEIRDLARRLGRYKIYEGDVSRYKMPDGWGADSFPSRKNPFGYAAGLTANFGRLIYRSLFPAPKHTVH